MRPADPRLLVATLNALAALLPLIRRTPSLSPGVTANAIRSGTGVSVAENRIVFTPVIATASNLFAQSNRGAIKPAVIGELGVIESTNVRLSFGPISTKGFEPLMMVLVDASVRL